MRIATWNRLRLLAVWACHFVPRRWTTRLSRVIVGGFDEWVGAGLSDHVPLMVEIAS
jgi:hypothetical protein